MILTIKLILACHYSSNNLLKFTEDFIMHLYKCLAIAVYLVGVHADEDVADYVDIVAEEDHRHLMNHEQVDAFQGGGTDVIVHYFCDLRHLLVDCIEEYADVRGGGIVFEESRLETTTFYQTISYQLYKSDVDGWTLGSLYQLTLTDQMVILSQEAVEADIKIEYVAAPLNFIQWFQPVVTIFGDFKAGKVNVYLIDQSLNEWRQPRQSLLEICNRNGHFLMSHVGKVSVDAERLTIITHQDVMQDVGLTR